MDSESIIPLAVVAVLMLIGAGIFAGFYEDSAIIMIQK